MPDHLKALIFILIVATTVFALAKAPACAVAWSTEDFKRRRILWFLLTLTAFLSHNFWIFMAVAAVILLTAGRSERNKLAMFFLLVFALPRISAEVPGMGLVNVLFTIDFGRLLALTVLLPAYLAARKLPGTEPFGRSLPDKFLAGYLILGALLLLNQQTLAVTLREGVFYAFIDTYLPYYVASRCVRNLQEFRDALMAFAVAVLLLSAILVAESALRLLFYTTLVDALGMPWGWSFYLLREGNLRVYGAIGHPIAAGFVVAVGAGLYLYLKKVVPSAKFWGLGLVLLLLGLIAPLSRGPWMGYAAMVLVFVALGPSAALNFAKIGLLCLLALPILLATPAGDSIIAYLPWVGTVESQTITGREMLLQASIEVLLQSPFFGNRDYADNPTMQAVTAANQGFLDLVNTYVVVGLGRGFVGLTLFAGFFLAAGTGIYRSMRKIPDSSDEQHLLGRALLATLVGILVIIGTCSPVLVIPYVYLTVAGLGVAYARMVARGKAPDARQPVPPRAVTEPRGRVLAAHRR